MEAVQPVGVGEQLGNTSEGYLGNVGLRSEVPLCIPDIQHHIFGRKLEPAPV